MKETVPLESASAVIDAKIKELGDWRGKMLAKVREIIHQADRGIVEEWKWVKATSPGTPVWSHGGIVCTGETYKNAVKMTFAKGAALKDPARLFNSSLDGNVRRAIDIHEGTRPSSSASRPRAGRPRFISVPLIALLSFRWASLLPCFVFQGLGASLSLYLWKETGSVQQAPGHDRNPKQGAVLARYVLKWPASTLHV